MAKLLSVEVVSSSTDCHFEGIPRQRNLSNSLNSQKISTSGQNDKPAFGAASLYLKYDDGLEGELSLEKVFRGSNVERQELPSVESAVIEEISGDILVNNSISLCKNASYEILKLKQMAKNLGLDFGD